MKRLTMTAAAGLAIVVGMAFLCGGCATWGGGEDLDEGWLSGALARATSWARTIDEDQVRDAWAAAERVRDIIDGRVILPVAPVGTNVAAVITNQCESFLFDRGAIRCMNVAHLAATPESVQTIIDRKLANGDNVAWIFVHNQGDGSPVPTTLYREGYGGAVDQARLDHWRSVAQRCRDNGLVVIGVMTADDSPEIYNATTDQHLNHVRNCISNLDDTVDGWWVGLEMDSDKRRESAHQMITLAKELTDDLVGVHLNKGRWADAVSWGAEILYYQASKWDPSPDEAKAEATRILANLDGRCGFVYSEYCLSSDTPAAKAIGAAVAQIPGVWGTGNGR